MKKQISDFKDRYVIDVINNMSLNNLPDEEWKCIEAFENYAVSNYGRIKSLERWVTDQRGRKRKVSEQIMKLQFMKFFNKYLKRYFYNITCLLSSEGKRSRRSVPRLVYSHFIEKIDNNDESYLISFKDNNRFNIHMRNLEKLSISEEHFKRVQMDRVQNHKAILSKAVSQYTVSGELIANFENIEAASKSLQLPSRYILHVINKKRMTAGGFIWFLKEHIPTKEDFIPGKKNKTKQTLNVSLWKKLGKPKIDMNNPPACMNLSLKNLPGEKWLPVPGLSELFSISNKGRIKRLNSWNAVKNKSFLNEKIISLFLDSHYKTSYYLYANISNNGKRVQIRLNKLLYYCFVKEFDLKDRSLIVINKSKPQWNIDISKLELCSAAFYLNKRNINN